MNGKAVWVMAAFLMLPVGSLRAAMSDEQAAVAPPEIDRDLAKEFAAGLTAMERGDLEEAARRFRLVADRDPKSFEAHNNLAVIYAEQGRNEEALAELRIVLKLRPEYYRGRKNLAELYARLAGQSFAEAAAVAPPEEREDLIARARALGAADGGAMAAAPKAAEPKAVEPKVGEPSAVAAPQPPAPAPADKALENAPPFLALGDEGAYGLVVEAGAVDLYQQKGGVIRLAERFPAVVGGGVPQRETWYTAKEAGGGIDLIPLGGEGPRLTIAKSGTGATRIRVEAPALERLTSAVTSFLTPAVAGAAERGTDPEQAALRADVTKAFRQWQSSWSSKELRPYVDSYAPDYAPAGRTHQAWEEQRAAIFSKSGAVTVEQSPPVILWSGADEVVTLSQQRYVSELQVSSGVKSLEWIRSEGGWRIRDERMLSEKVESARR